MADEFDAFESYDVKTAEERAKNGGMVSIGKHKARLHGANRIESSKKATPGWELTFVITEGAFKDCQVTDTLYVTDVQKSQDRLCLFGHRLGLLEKKGDGSGYARVKGKVDFKDCLDTPCIIDVIHEPDQKNPDKKWPRLAFAGVISPNDPGASKSASSAPTPTAPDSDKKKMKAANL